MARYRCSNYQMNIMMARSVSILISFFLECEHISVRPLWVILVDSDSNFAYVLLSMFEVLSCCCCLKLSSKFERFARDSVNVRPIEFANIFAPEYEPSSAVRLCITCVLWLSIYSSSLQADSWDVDDVSEAKPLSKSRTYQKHDNTLFRRKNSWEKNYSDRI